MRNNTKIVATIGPSSSSKEVLKEMMLAGMNVARINFSHGSHEDHKKVIETVRELNDELKMHTALLGDLQGPKLRVGKVKEGSSVEIGQTFKFTNEECEGDSTKAYMTYSSFASDVKAGDRVLVDDGKLMFIVKKTDGKKEVICEVVQGGPLSSNKGVNLPNTDVSLPCLTEKDLVDLDFALEMDLSWIGLSFVRSASDLIELKSIIQETDSRAKVIAKIEKPEAVLEMDDIIDESDAIMVARGDLGVEIPLYEVPLTQKLLVEKARQKAKPVIIATQMMESMISSMSPTRAEVNDVANAVLDGTDAVMLSGETSVGDYPVQVIETMVNIIAHTETKEGIYHKEVMPTMGTDRDLTDAICFNSCRLAQSVGASAIITMTFSGYTAFKISSNRPKAKVFIFTSNVKILSMLSLIWGVQGFYYDKFVSTDHTISDIKYNLRKMGYVDNGDLVVNIASMPIKEKGMTNMLKLSYVN